MELRPFEDPDLVEVFEINDEAVPAVGREPSEQLAHIAHESIITVVATDPDADDRVAGFCFVLAPGADYASQNYAWFEQRFESYIYLDRIAIRPEYQGRGLGRQMYAEVERLTAERLPAATHFTLEVNTEPRNQPSLDFHARMGFVEVGARNPTPGYAVSMMAKPLQLKPGQDS